MKSNWVTRELPHPSTKPPTGTFGHASFGSLCIATTIIQVEYAKRGPNDDTPLSHYFSSLISKTRWLANLSFPPKQQRGLVIGC
ncbi:hypothetical protein SMAC4_13623 [Sordaria macrospora]|uniref:uncharacterized protein n=1 Tax=Sordaria macrospora TaxID=5147 RepID=UPI002B313974|nr:hypothetical protein SMAC4_13623 [Sordaria macrospora]